MMGLLHTLISLRDGVLTSRRAFLVGVFVLVFSCLLGYCQGLTSTRRAYYSTRRTTYYGSYYRSSYGYGGGIRGGSVAGVVIGCLIAALIITLAVYFCIRFCCPKQYQKCCGHRQGARVYPTPRQAPKRVQPIRMAQMNQPRPGGPMPMGGPMYHQQHHRPGGPMTLGPPSGPPQPPVSPPPPYYGPPSYGPVESAAYPDGSTLYGPGQGFGHPQAVPPPVGPTHQPAPSVPPPAYDAVYSNPQAERY